jgi:hypothetical protein
MSECKIRLWGLYRFNPEALYLTHTEFMLYPVPRTQGMALSLDVGQKKGRSVYASL